MENNWDETFELDFFLRNLLDDLKSVTPSFGCELTGKVNYSDATGYGQPNTHKNQLFLYFTELAQRIDTISLRISMDETQDHWEVGFEFGHQGIALEEVPHWDPRNFKLGEELRVFAMSSLSRPNPKSP
jgi:hypothetical protein